MTRSVWQRPPGPDPADVAVVGGGVVGAATAHALGRLAPGCRVVLLEGRRIGHGASGRNAGFLMLGTHADYASAAQAYGRERARRLWAFTRENLALAEALPASETGVRRTGSVLAAGTPAEAERLAAAHALLGDDGVATELLGPAEAARRSGMRGFEAALVVAEGDTVDPLRLVRHLAATSGARVLEDAPVEALEPDPAGVRLALAGGGEVRAGRVLLALNAFLPRLVPALGHAVRPVRAQMLATAAAGPLVPAPVYSHDGYFYVRQHADGRILLGGARHLHEADETGYDDAVTDALQQSLERYLARHLPEAAGLPVERRWSGTMGFSEDGLPRLGRVPDVPGAFWAAGFTGHGMGLGLRFGQLAARVLLGEHDPAACLFAPEEPAPGTRVPAPVRPG